MMHSGLRLRRFLTASAASLRFLAGAGGAPYRPSRWRAWMAVSAALLAAPARASFLSGEALDTAADVLTIVVLVIVPVVGIVVLAGPRAPGTFRREAAPPAAPGSAPATDEN
jgi:hypothetical protein